MIGHLWVDIVLCLHCVTCSPSFETHSKYAWKLRPVGSTKAKARSTGDKTRLISGICQSTARFSKIDAFISDDMTDQFQKQAKYDSTRDRATSARKDRWTLRSPMLLGKLGH